MGTTKGIEARVYYLFFWGVCVGGGLIVGWLVDVKNHRRPYRRRRRPIKNHPRRRRRRRIIYDGCC